MKLKLDDKGNVVVQDGKPVYVKDDGSEVAFDAVGTVNTISRLNGEAKANRERAEAVEAKLKGFEGIEDPEAARKALQTVSSLDAKKLMGAGEVEKVKSEISKAYQTQLDEAKSQAERLQQQLHGEIVGGSFARSKLIAEKKVLAPLEMVKATFEKHFVVEDGKLVAKDNNGNKIYSQSNPGELASFDESLEMLVKASPFANQILAGVNASGSGAGSNSTSGAKQNTISRTDFAKLDPVQQATFARQKDAQITD